MPPRAGLRIPVIPQRALLKPSRYFYAPPYTLVAVTLRADVRPISVYVPLPSLT